MKVSDLKIGAKLVFGAYGAGDDVHPITWLKATKDCDFLSEFVLDILQFDARERANTNSDCWWYGNIDYELSNIVQYMNSCDSDWYTPSHEFDAQPIDNRVARHPGFLHYFEDYELECLASRINLPTVENIVGTGVEPRFPLFNRKGFRGRPSIDIVNNTQGYVESENSFCSFWVSNPYGDTTIKYIDRGGYVRRQSPCSTSGMRPKCVIAQDAEVEELPDGSGYRLAPFTVPKAKRKGVQVCTDEEFLQFMGLL